MEKREVIHTTFSIERFLPASPEQVFHCFADQKAKARWFGGPEAWEKSDYMLEFKLGGKEHISGGPPEGPVHTYEAVIQDIVPNERIITTYEMYLDAIRISVSVATFEFRPSGTGTQLVLTEQGAYLDGHDTSESRERGTNDLLDKLAASFASQTNYA